MDFGQYAAAAVGVSFLLLTVATNRGSRKAASFFTCMLALALLGCVVAASGVEVSF